MEYARRWEIPVDSGHGAIRENDEKEVIMETIELFGRIVCPITSPQGQKTYYDHLNYRRSCCQNSRRRIIPTLEEAEEYRKLKKENPSILGDLQMRKKYKKLMEYEHNYDWRPTKSGTPHHIGLVSPSGEQLLPNIFEDVFTEFDTQSDDLKFIPVSNGNGWAIASLGSDTVLMTEFLYSAIVLERWERTKFFVQDKETLKWGVLRTICQSSNNKISDSHYLYTIGSIMPCMADEIYEDEFMVEDTEEMPSLFFMLQVGNKVGVLTDFGYSKVIYDTYETNSKECSFRLICNDRKRALRANWWSPDGKE